MCYIGLDLHKKTISFCVKDTAGGDKKTISCCVKDAAGCVHSEGKIGATRRELDAWVITLPPPRMMAMDAAIFTGWINDYLLPHAEKVKVPQVDAARAFTSSISLTPCRGATWTREGRT